MTSVEGVWAKDLEEAFEEALAVYPPCGRRKIILSEEGKMYGRNELIARYIKMRTGKTRTRKQVSSHIQVLARKRGRENQKNKQQIPQQAQPVYQQPQQPQQPQPVSQSPVPQYPPYVAAPPTPTQFMPPYMPPQKTKPPSSAMFNTPPGLGLPAKDNFCTTTTTTTSVAHTLPLQKMTIMPTVPRMSLMEFTVYLETPGAPPTQHTFIEIKDTEFASMQLEEIDIRQLYSKFPSLNTMHERGPKDNFFLIKCWVDLSVPTLLGFFGMNSKYHSPKSTSIKSSFKLFKQGKPVLEKVQVEYPMIDNGGFCYFFNRSPLCDYMIGFIERLKAIETREELNEAVHDFAVLQTIIDRDTNETLLTIAFLFGVSDERSQYQIYRVNDE